MRKPRSGTSLAKNCTTVISCSRYGKRMTRQIKKYAAEFHTSPENSRKTTNQPTLEFPKPYTSPQTPNQVRLPTSSTRKKMQPIHLNTIECRQNATLQAQAHNTEPSKPNHTLRRKQRIQTKPQVDRPVSNLKMVDHGRHAVFVLFRQRLKIGRFHG